jgi:hypothetical protein
MDNVHEVCHEQDGHCNGNALDLYARSIMFKSRPGY